MLQVGVIGAGSIARSHVRGLQSVADVRIAAIHDIDRSAATELANSCGADVSDTAEELIAVCDAVFVCTWTGAHREIVQAVVAAGRAVFCEKPLAPTLADARSMTDAVLAAGVVNQVGLPLRWLPGFALLPDFLADPEVGEVLSVSLHTEMAVRESAVTGWRRDVTRAGGGVLLEVGFHDMDLLEWLFGPMTTLGISMRPGRYPGIEDAASVCLRLAGDAVGTLVTTWHEAPSPYPARRLHVVCERAQFVAEGGTRLTISGPGDRRITADESELAEMGRRQGLASRPHEAFARSVLDGRPATPDFTAALRVHELLDVAYRSASERATLDA